MANNNSENTEIYSTIHSQYSDLGSHNFTFDVSKFKVNASFQIIRRLLDQSSQLRITVTHPSQPLAYGYFYTDVYNLVGNYYEFDIYQSYVNGLLKGSYYKIEFDVINRNGEPSGVQGPTGQNGIQGPTGLGATGPTGSAGQVGATGPTGSSGVDGDPGLDGATGPTGPAGALGGGASATTLATDTAIFTGSGTYVTMTGMVTVPAAGDYVVTFSASGRASDVNGQCEYHMRKNSTPITGASRLLNYDGTNATSGANYWSAMSAQAFVSLNGTDGISMVYRVANTTGNFHVGSRSMILLKIA